MSVIPKICQAPKIISEEQPTIIPCTVAAIFVGSADELMSIEPNNFLFSMIILLINN